MFIKLIEAVFFVQIVKPFKVDPDKYDIQQNNEQESNKTSRSMLK